MTISKLSTDGPEWTLYDRDLSTAWGILNKHIDASLYLKLNDSGSGSMTLPLSDPMLGVIKTGQFVALNYRGDYRGGFLVENIELVEVAFGENPALAIKLSGRGPLALLGHAIVFDWWTPGIEDVRHFGTLNTMPDGGHPVPCGEIMYKLLDEAENYQINPALQTLERYCWRIGGVIGGTAMLVWDFTATDDSNSTPWSDTHDIDFRIGVSHLDVMRQIAALQYDFTITRNTTTGVFTLHAYDSRIGTDLSGTIIFRRGKNVTEASRKENNAEMVNALLVEFSDPINPFTHVDELAYITSYVFRRESLLQASNAKTAAEAAIYGQAEIDTLKDPTTSIAIKVSDTETPNIFLDYNLGDIIGYDKGGTLLDYRVTGAQLAWTGDDKYADVVVELQ